MTRICKECGDEKDLELFYRNKHSKDGRLPICSVCFREKQDRVKLGTFIPRRVFPVVDRSPVPCVECGRVIERPAVRHVPRPVKQSVCSTECRLVRAAKTRIGAKEDVVNRFLSQVIPEPNSGCWLWMGECLTTGYGYFYSALYGPIKGAHRWAYRHYKGPLVKKLGVLHKCDNRLCCNPDHLYQGDQADNMQDCLKRGRNPRANLTHCLRGHEFSATNTAYYKGPGDRLYRRCLACCEWRAINKSISIDIPSQFKGES